MSAQQELRPAQEAPAGLRAGSQNSVLGLGPLQHNKSHGIILFVT